MNYQKTVLLDDDVCAGCECDLPKGTEIITDRETELIFCDEVCAEEFFEADL